jgi:hypothetical protein
MKCCTNGICLIFTAFGFIACVGRDAQTRAADSAATVPVSSSTPSRKLAQAPKITGISLVVDSTKAQPTVERGLGEYVVRLPREMAHELYDHLPDFMPLSRSAYDSALATWVDTHDSAASALSVVIGDFDGDARTDIAMIGTSQDSVAQIILLARSDSTGKPRLLFLGPQQSATPQYPEMTYFSPLHASRLPNGFSLRTDGVRVIEFEQTQVLYYLDRGVLRQAYTSGD